MKLPAHMKIQLSAFVRTDKGDAGAEIKVGGCVDTDVVSSENIKLDGFTTAACQALNAMLEVDDARPMTADEVKEYEADQRNDERAQGRISEAARLSDIEDEDVDARWRRTI